MFRRIIPVTLAALVTTGALTATAVEPSPRSAEPTRVPDRTRVPEAPTGVRPHSGDGPCPQIEVPDSAPPTTTVSDDDPDDRCDIDPESYYLAYESPDRDETAATAAPAGGAAVDRSADAVHEVGVVVEPPPAPPEPGPLDDNTFVDEGDSTWVATENDRESTFALDVDTGSFSVAQRFLAEGYLPEPDSIRAEEWINSFSYGDEPASGDDLGITVDSTIDGPEETALVRIGIATTELDPIERPAANVTFVIDTSGSMDIRERLGMVKASLALLVKNLRPDDTISIVTYGDVATPVLRPTPVTEWRDIVDAIDELRPGGSTNMESGLLLGYEQARQSFDNDDINVVVLASDGVANVGSTDPELLTDQITQAGEEGIHLVTVGYGMGNYNDYLMEQLANQGDGFYSYIDSFDEAERLFVDDLTPTLYVVAEQAKVQVVFDPEVVEEYRLIGYENRMLDDEDFTDDTVDAGELGAGHRVSALYELDLVDGADPDDAAGEVRLRWQSVSDGEVVELSEDIAIGGGGASPSLQLAAVVGYTAELLKGNSVVTERGLTLEALHGAAVDLADEGVDGAAEMAEFLEAALDLDEPDFLGDGD